MAGNADNDGGTRPITGKPGRLRGNAGGYVETRPLVTRRRKRCRIA